MILWLHDLPGREEAEARILAGLDKAAKCPTKLQALQALHTALASEGYYGASDTEAAVQAVRILSRKRHEKITYLEYLDAICPPWKGPSP